MEINKIELESNNSKIRDIIIEPFHFVEEIKNGDQISIILASVDSIPANTFDIKISENEIVVYLNFNLSAKYKLNVLINSIKIIEFGDLG